MGCYDIEIIKSEFVAKIELLKDVRQIICYAAKDSLIYNWFISKRAWKTIRNLSIHLTNSNTNLFIINRMKTTIVSQLYIVSKVKTESSTI